MTKTSNVRTLPSSELPSLPLAATSQAGGEIKGSRNEIWLCPAYSSGVGLMLYVKPRLSHRAMFVEALAAQLGQCLKLPCPNPYLVTVNPLHVGLSKGPSFLAFGSEQVNERGMSFAIRDLDLLIGNLDRLKLSEAVCAFDEWIANTVRSPSDVLFDPERGAFLIDHEGSMESSTRPDSQVTNWLAMRLVERLKESERPALLRALRAKTTAAHRAKLEPIPGTVLVVPDGMLIYTALLTFLEKRLLHLDKLLSQRVLPNQMYLMEQPLANDETRGAA
jgi:hypothetical protein